VWWRVQITEFIVIRFFQFLCSFRSFMSRYFPQHDINSERRLFVERAAVTNSYRDTYLQSLREHLYRAVYLNQCTAKFLGSSSLHVSPEHRLLPVPKLFAWLVHDSRRDPAARIRHDSASSKLPWYWYNQPHEHWLRGSMASSFSSFETEQGWDFSADQVLVL
jgi:hypothetical protein